MIGAPPKAATEVYAAELDRIRRLVALRVQTLALAVVDPGDAVGWARLTALGTDATVVAQQAAKEATAAYALATLEAAGAPLDPVDVPIQPGYLGSGRDVQGLFSATSGVVQGRTVAGATFSEALAASAQYLVGVASSEPHRIGRDGLLGAGLRDDRFERYRRVAVGATCDFCLMLATRGAVYLSAASAGESRKYHRHCDCRIELVVGADSITRSTELQGDWRNAMRDEQRLIDAGAMDGAPTAIRPPGVSAVAPGMPRAALRVDGMARELTEAELVAREGAFAAGVTQRRFRVYADGDLTVKVRRKAGSTDPILSDAELGTFMAEWREVTTRVYRDMPEGYAPPIAVIDDTDMTWVREPGCLAYVVDPRALTGVEGVVRVNPRAARGDFNTEGDHFAPALAGSTDPAERIRYVLTHEWGHLHSYAWPDATAAMERADVARVTVSGYAAESSHEAYAEAFADWVLGRPPSPRTRQYARLVGWESP